jgi:TRAP-type C4-dicarboxylate transport system permease small subunit
VATRIESVTTIREGSWQVAKNLNFYGVINIYNRESTLMSALKSLRRAERVTLVTLFVLMVVLFFVNVVVREFGGTFASKLAWIEEAVRLMNIFLVFGALGLALERGKHVGIDSFREKMPDNFYKPLLKTIDLVGFCFSIYLSYLSLGLVQFVLSTGQRSPTLDLPMGWIYCAPVAGFGLLALRFALSFCGIVERFSAGTRETQEAK